MDLINELIKRLEIIDYSRFDENFINVLLDCRDSNPFDTQWCRVEKEINALKNEQTYPDERKKEQGKLRERAFMIIEQSIGSELSEYVSDDFGLIYDSLVLDYKDKWLDKLIEQYRNKQIPAGEL